MCNDKIYEFNEGLEEMRTHTMVVGEAEAFPKG